jgi:hypothetical protein
MTRTVLYTLRHLGGPLDGTIVDVVSDNDGTRIVVRELHVTPNYRGGGGTVELVTQPEEPSAT